MIAPLMEFRQEFAIKRALELSSQLLSGKLQRILNPNVIDATLRVSITIEDGRLRHIRDYESEPAYVHGLQKRKNDLEVKSVLLSALNILRNRLESRLVPGWYGTIGLSIAICHGEATITSDADGVRKL